MFKRLSFYTFVIAVCLTLLLMSYAALQYIPELSEERALLTRVPQLTTDRWAVFDPTTGDVQYGGKAYEAHPIASITKLFTAYEVVHAGMGNATTAISWSDLSTEGNSGKLSYGEVVSLYDLLFPLLIESSNDAGSAIARTLGSQYGIAFSDLQKRLSLTHTALQDATGLGEKNISSPHDLAQVYVYLRSNHPHIIDITRLRMHITNNRGLINNNPLLSLQNYGGGKHGYTPEAGRTFVGTVFVSEDKEVGIVLLNSSDLIKDVAEIRDSLK